jgi:hypothetical protein
MLTETCSEFTKQRAYQFINNQYINIIITTHVGPGISAN